MNTRKSIQTTTDPAVLSLSFSVSRNRFATSLSDGARVFRTDNCLTTCRPSFGKAEGLQPSIAICEVLDDRYMAYVPRRGADTGTSNIVIFWDCVLDKEVTRFDLYEPIVGVRLCAKWMVVLLRERAVVFQYQELQPRQQATPSPEPGSDNDFDSTSRGPNKVHGICPTAPNNFALASLRDDLLVLPAQAIGQVQLVPLPSGSKRVIRAHNSTLRQFALSLDGKLLATASEQGTLIRVFDLATTDQIAEFRRGVDKAVILSLAFSARKRWLASTSDKGTLHVFDLRPSTAASENAAGQKYNQASGQSRQRHSSFATHRLSAGSDRDSQSNFSSRSPTRGRGSAGPASSTAVPASALHTGSVQEYYGLRPIPGPSAVVSGRETAASALSALRSAGWAPKVLRDTRSIASAPFWMGEDGEGSHWQARGTAATSAYVWITAPSGSKVRVANPVPPLPNDPSGRPPKGILAFAPPEGSATDDGSEDGAVVLYVVGGGAEGRWEMFDLVPSNSYGSGWALGLRGFRRFLSRQFVD